MSPRNSNQNNSNPQRDSSDTVIISVVGVIVAGAAVAAGAIVVSAWHYWKHQRGHDDDVDGDGGDGGDDHDDDDDDDEVERLKADVARLKNALKKVARHYHGDFPDDIDMLSSASSSSSSSSSTSLSMQSKQTPKEWRRCMIALTQFETGYQRRQHLNGTKQKGSRRRTTSTRRQENTKGAMHGGSILMSNFLPSTAATTDKETVCALLVARTARHFPRLVADMERDPRLIIVILDAPSCGTSRALCAAMPSLPHTRICVPQADPTHLVDMTHAGCGGDMFLNIRAQRLDQWLVANANCNLHVAILFADYETSIYGKPALAFSPLRDIQRFFRLGYAANKKRCLFGITLSFRPPHPTHCLTLEDYTLLVDADNTGSNNSSGGAEAEAEATTSTTTNASNSDSDVPVAPRLAPADLVGFMAAEAAAVGLRSTLVETHHYGMSFFLFLVEQQEHQ